jgi:3-oxoacyl-[acyl-carrier-protein] synthase-3
MKTGMMNIPNNRVRIAGTGNFLPGSPFTIDEVDDILGELTDAPPKIQSWLRRMKDMMKQMVEVENYYYAIDPVTHKFTEDNVTMAVKAAYKALEMADMKPSEIEFIAYGSAHQDQMPAASVRIQEALGIENCGEISVHANCTSAYKALLVAYDFVKSGRYKNALVLSASTSSSQLRAGYYNQPIVKKEELFLRYFLCDGAGAVVIKSDDMESGGLFIENIYIESPGGKKPSAMKDNRPAYWMNPKEEFEKGFHHLSQMFQEELRNNFHEPGGTIFYHGLERMLKKYPADLSRLKYFQVNFPSRHISELVMDECTALGIPKETLYTKMSTMGYAGPPMVFICLDKILREEKLLPGDLILSFVTEVSKFMQAGFTLKYC